MFSPPDFPALKRPDLFAFSASESVSFCPKNFLLGRPGKECVDQPTIGDAKGAIINQYLDVKSPSRSRSREEHTPNCSAGRRCEHDLVVCPHRRPPDLRAKWKDWIWRKRLKSVAKRAVVNIDTPWSSRE